MNIASATTIAMEFRAPAEQDGTQLVFRAEVTAESERDAFEQGANVGRMIWKLAEGFCHGQALMTPMLAPEPQMWNETDVETT